MLCDTPNTTASATLAAAATTEIRGIQTRRAARADRAERIDRGAPRDGRSLVIGGSWRVRSAAASTWARIWAGGCSATARASRAAVSRSPRTSDAQDPQ